MVWIKSVFYSVEITLMIFINYKKTKIKYMIIRESPNI